MKISKVQVVDLIDYLRLDADLTDVEALEIERMKDSALSHIMSYTGLTLDQLDEHEDITQCLFLLVADYFDNRNLYLDNKTSKVNQAVDSILRMHAINYL